MPEHTGEIMPFEYDGTILQRELESMSDRLNKIEGMSSEGMNALRQDITDMQGELGETSEALRQQNAGQQSVLPVVDSDTLTVIKFLPIPIVYTQCKPIEVIKYPHVGGYQFFASPELNFTPLTESSLVNLEGTCESSHATDLYVSASVSPIPSLGAAYKNMPFWSDMDLNGKKIQNLTTGATGSITTWVNTQPLRCQGTGISWTAGDQYRIYDVPRPRNLIGQGPLPFAIKIISAGFNLTNPGWDGKSYFVKVRTLSRGLPRSRRYGQFVQQGSLPLDSGLPAPTITASPFFYLNHILVKWTSNWDYVGQGLNELDHWKVYRTTANDTALCDDETYVVDDGGNGLALGGRFRDHGYNATTHPNGPEPNVTYYYWVRAFDKDGNKGALSVSDNAVLGIAADPVIDSIVEESTNNWFGTKNYDVVWTCAGGAEGYKVKRQRKLNGVYGLWTPPIIVNHMTDQGLIGGEDKQIHTFHNLRVGNTYKIGIQAIQNWQILGLNSNWVTQDVTIGDSAPPDAPT